MKILLKGGTIVTASDTFCGDILVEGSKISAVASNIDESFYGPVDKVIDAEGKYVIPGGIDVHTHFHLPVKGTFSADGFASGSKAAACGGVTTFIDFAHQTWGESALKALDERINEAIDEVYIDYSLHLGLTDINDKTLKEIPLIIERGVPSFKLYMVYAKEGLISNDADIYNVLKAVRDCGGLVIIHAENPYLIDNFTEKLSREEKLAPAYLPQSRPNFCETEAIRRALYLTEITGSRIYIVHISTSESVEILAEAKGRGIMAFAETCPQYLLLTEDIYFRKDGYLYTSNPPLRDFSDQRALWKGLGMGSIQVVSTDHCTFTKSQRETGKNDFTKLPNGLPGVETLVSLIYSEGVRRGKIGLNQWIDLISTNPAKMFGLYPRKGALIPGADADIVVFDPEKSAEIKAKNLHYNIDYSPYEDLRVTGWVETTISKGEIIYDKGHFSAKKGRGEFIPRDYYTA